MRGKKILIFLLSLLVAIGFSYKQSFASFAEIKGLFDWDKLNIVGDIIWIPESQFTESRSEVWNITSYDSDYKTINSWGDLITEVSIEQAYASGAASSSLLYVHSKTGPNGEVFPGSETEIFRFGLFEYIGVEPGYVIFSIPVKIDFYLSSSPIPEAFAEGSINAWIYLGYKMDGYYKVSSEGIVLEDSVYSGDSRIYNIEDEFTIIKKYKFRDIGVFAVELNADSKAYVPIPSTFILLVSGLICLIGIGRFRKRLF